MRRLAVLHTVGMLVDRFKGLLAGVVPTGVDVVHMLDESLLRDLMRDGAGPEITRRVVAFATQAADAGAELIVFTCSSTSPAIDTARQVVRAPILKIDDPMAARAVELGPRIGIVCTTSSTRGPSEALVRDHAAKAGRDVAVEALLVPGAFDALQAGRRDEHDRLVSAAALEVAGRNDVLVLAQASLAHLAEPLAAATPRPVLSSPPLCVEAIRRHYAAG
ncbi:MAG: Asp/Glu/hydantoin racemase [Alphaproteobacteria bacterium]|nr:Asp/Glu/hydantoin racemase [Alphaproteobacteria bacterium]